MAENLVKNVTPKKYLKNSLFIGNPGNIAYIDATHVVVCAIKGNALSPRITKTISLDL